MMLREPWRTRLLFLSFAVNLVSIPVAVSSAWKRPPHDAPGPPRTEAMIEHLARDLPPADGAALRAAMGRHVDDIDAARQRMVAARREMSHTIGRAPYDAQAVGGSMRAWQGAWQVWSEQLGVAMLEALPTLSDQGRQELSQAGRRKP